MNYTTSLHISVLEEGEMKDASGDLKENILNNRNVNASEREWIA